jgi:hypothetical protein
MDKAHVDQLAKEMTELCKNTARSAVLFAGSPTGKMLFIVVLTVIIGEPPTDDRLWWKPPLPI